ncbi:unnamed protein product [Fraxinus pennsylvanica]|uniref:Uncharacterized protein n=1 Tax=Fraxinus pennsylvanica TaxID=56036 RepID=A0AAD2EAG1_9LAMI|nr:unnamed protein product [Fraxinus pennsylvanica]
MGFKSAAESDLLWKQFLPSDYQDIIARSVSPVVYSSERELYFHLCDSPLLLDGGKLTLTESRFAEVAELLSVCWLEITGIMQTRMLSLTTNYAAYLVFKIHRNSFGLDEPSKASVKLVQQSGENNIVYLKRPTREKLRQLGVRNIDSRLAKERRDGWMEIELGEYFNDNGDGGDIQMQLRETEKLEWKSGLIIEGIELRPKEG